MNTPSGGSSGDVLQLRTRVHRLPENLTRETIRWQDQDLTALVIGPNDLGQPLPVTFEEASQSLLALPRCDCELDGFFVYSGGAGSERWQIEGNLFDRNGRLVQVDLRGHSIPGRLDDVLRCFGWPATRLMFELPREGLFLDEAEFRRVAALPAFVLNRTEG
jgi:hypothetical protein